MPLFAVGICILTVLIYGFWIYNKFIHLKQRGFNAFSDVDVQLKRRADLVPSLVEVVRGYAGHEHEVLTEVARARSRLLDRSAESSERQARGEDESNLATALQGIFFMIEEYPALKADTNFLKLHHTLVEIEDGLQQARRYYNAVVRDQKTLAQSVPFCWLAGVFAFQPLDYFQLDSEQRSVPALNLNSQTPEKSEGP